MFSNKKNVRDLSQEITSLQNQIQSLELMMDTDLSDTHRKQLRDMYVKYHKMLADNMTLLIRRSDRWRRIAVLMCLIALGMGAYGSMKHDAHDDDRGIRCLGAAAVFGVLGMGAMQRSKDILELWNRQTQR